ncbi:MAG TPA: bifunctional serine/threonine-protein kinase/formylglycine-generating enzyme family protein [Pyrinomonadaceae bacterium]|jgi:formylglycine-generating enzyme required for sulfatase activity/tRNA A-37 threonylcarbamoyl transferase component Bud32
MLAINEILRGRYRIIKQLGRGGMGAVYEAHDNVFDTTVALKEILVDLTKITTPKQQQLVRNAFEREAKILAMVKHEAFPHVRDYFVETDSQYLVMELVDGEDLGSLLERRQSPFPLANVLHWSNQLLDALDYLHTLNPPVVHRDIKPQNLKLTSRGKIKLLDFGIAKGKDAPAEATITNQTFVAATLNYSPLEQILRVLDPTFQEVITQRFDEKSRKVLSQAADAQSDLYALGATVYHLLTNKLPIDALKRALETWAGKPDPLQYPSELNSEIPKEVADWILKAMELEHDNRFSSAVEMHGALQNALEGEKTRDEENKKAQWAAEQQKLEQERRSMEEERRRIEEDRKVREEQQKRLLDESEAKRKFAEQQAADAEKRLTDSQGRELGATMPVFNLGATSEQPPTVFSHGSAVEQPPPSPFNQTIQEAKPIDTAHEMPKQTFTTETPTIAGQNKYSADPGLTAAMKPKKSSKILWAIPVLGLLFLLVGGGVGAWLLLKPSVDTPPVNNAIVNKSPSNTNNQTSKTTPPAGMVYVEGAGFTMGVDNADKADVAEMPAHQATVKSFFMDKYEVTREDYAKCVDAGKCTAPGLWKGNKYQDGTAKFPVVGVNFEQASDYAKWAGKRLPTEEEWEFAARGADKRAFPWGKTWESGKANANGAGKDFSEVGKFSGTSPFGVYDMVGNAWEWTSSEFKAYPNGSLPPNQPKGDLRVIRGGSYESTPQYASTTYRSGWPATGAANYNTTGFRCVKDIE